MAMIIAQVCSVAATVFAVGALTTIIPLAVAVLISMLSTPTPARPITFNFLPALMTASVTWVMDRVTKPSYSPMQAIRSSSLRLIFTSTSYPCARSTSTPFSDTSSLTKIFMLHVLLLEIPLIAYCFFLNSFIKSARAWQASSVTAL